MENTVGLRIFQHINRAENSLIKRFTGIPSSNIGDVMNRLYSMDSSIRPMGKTSLLGSAFTVKVAAGDNLFIHRALDLAQPGDVLVIDGGASTKRSLMGEIMFTYAKQKKLAGIIVNGCIRDQASLKLLDFPVYAIGTTPQGPYKHGPGEINVPISCGGQAILPGDIVAGDRDGICVIRKDDASQIVEHVIKKANYEKTILNNYRDPQILFHQHENEYILKTDCLGTKYYT